MDTLLREPEESEVPMSQKQKRQKFNKGGNFKSLGSHELFFEITLKRY